MSDEKLPAFTKTEAAASLVNMLHDIAEAAADGQDHGKVIAILRALQERPGVRTTEFWIASILSVAGLVMQFWPGHEVIGGVLTLGASSVYMLSRVAVKIKS